MVARHDPLNKITLGGLLVTLGIIYGDIGTSPLYVMNAIIGDRPISPELVLGGISCIFWTLTLQTTFKYVFLTLRADNKVAAKLLNKKQTKDYGNNNRYCR